MIERIKRGEKQFTTNVDGNSKGADGTMQVRARKKIGGRVERRLEAREYNARQD